ncbi:hypothetical protein CMT52_19535 [Elizabethkingia anophelis]|nr:hypothetical protein [Elizabethkingia anophelis]
METPKEQAIKAAYGELYIKHNPDENGWVQWNIKNDLGEENIESKVKGDKLIYRLKILRGIETNNGWTRIESEEDLPKYNSAGDFYVMSNEGNKVLLNGGNAVRNAYRLKTITHWQLIETKPPIF